MIVIDNETARYSSAMGTLLSVIVPVAAALFVIGSVVVVSPQPASAKPEFAAKTGLPCGRCHVSQTGGGPRTKFGEAFKANGYELPKGK